MMLALKCLGGLLVCGSCAVFGWAWSLRAAFRAADLAALRKAFLFLTGEVRYMLTPLPEAFANTAARTEEPVAAFFQTMADRLAAKDGASAAEIWEFSIAELRSASHITDEDIRGLTPLGRSFGNLDGETLANSLMLAGGALEETITAIQAQSLQNARMHKSVGTMVGILITIVLL